MKTFWKLNWVVIFVISLANCGGGASSDGAIDLPSNEPGGEVGSVSGNGFWIDVPTENNFSVWMHKNSTFGSECFIDSSATTSSSQICNIEVLELDSYAQDINIQWNVPPGMCDYVTVTPSWHWNRSVGNGPTELLIQKNQDGIMTQIAPRTDGGCAARQQDGTWTACTANPEISAIAIDGTATCAYDERELDDGINCCFGNVTITTEQDANNNGTIDAGETSSEIKTWGGEVENCIGGATKSNGWETTNQGYPVTLLYNVANDGRNEVIEIPANSQDIRSSFQYGVNYYETTSGTPHNHSGYVSTATSTAPYAFVPIDDLDGSPVNSGQVSYAITCVERADEIKHRWEVYIREWNTYAEWITWNTSLGISGDPNISGTEGGGGANDCDYESGFGTNPCNDFNDWENILDGTTGNIYDTTIIDYIERKKFFPYITY